MAEYLTSAGQDAHIAMALYALVFEGMSVAFCFIFAWTMGEGRSHRPVPRERRARAWLQFGVGLLLYLVATGVAFVSAPAALVIIGLVAVYYMVDPRPAAVRRAESGL
jgi:hypothetical protein